MCVVSAVMGEWWGTFKNPFELPQTGVPWTFPTMPTGVPVSIPAQPDPLTVPPQPAQPGPNAVSWNIIQEDPKLAQMMLDVLSRLEAIDNRLGLMEQCLVEKGEKTKIKRKLRRIAKKTPKKKAAK
jgi:hypothetical protein